MAHRLLESDLKMESSTHLKPSISVLLYGFLSTVELPRYAAEERGEMSLGFGGRFHLTAQQVFLAQKLLINSAQVQVVLFSRA